MVENGELVVEICENDEEMMEHVEIIVQTGEVMALNCELMIEKWWTYGEVNVEK